MKMDGLIEIIQRVFYFSLIFSLSVFIAFVYFLKPAITHVSRALRIKSLCKGLVFIFVFFSAIVLIVTHSKEKMCYLV